MWTAYTSTAQDKSDFISCLLRFREQRPLLVAQTPANFAGAVVAYVNNLLPAEREANATRRQANAAEAIAAPVAVAAHVAAAAIVAPPQHQQQAAGRGAQNGRGAQQGRGGRGAQGGRGPAAAPPGQPRAYCHTHGCPDPGQRGHHSIGCNTPGANHEWHATFDNQMGGKAAV